MTSQQQPGSETEAGTRRRPVSTPQSRQSSTFGAGGSSGFGTQSQWRRPDPRFSPPTAYPAARPEGQWPAADQGFADPPQPSQQVAPQAQFPPQNYQSPQNFPPTQQFPPAQYPQRQSYPSQSYPQQSYPSQPYLQQSYPPQPYPQQSYPPQGYPYLPPYPQQSTAPQRRSVLPVVILCVVALIAVLGITALTQRGGSETPTEVQYQNNDYTIPAVAGKAPQMPVPRQSEADQWVRANKIYSIEMAKPVRCDATAVNALDLNDVEMHDHLNQVLECLLRVWGPALEQAGYTATRPTITVMDTPKQTACGKMTMKNAMFCGNDQNLYFASDLPTLFDPSLRTKAWVIESVLAHEYGHAFQGRTGIIPARNLLADAASMKEDAYRLVRRNEAQADCLAGMFFNSTRQSLGLTATDEQTIIETFRSIGSDRDGKDNLSTHPKMATRKAWVTTGLQNTSIGACNTYSVPANEVA